MSTTGKFKLEVYLEEVDLDPNYDFGKYADYDFYVEPSDEVSDLIKQNFDDYLDSFRREIKPELASRENEFTEVYHERHERELVAFAHMHMTGDGPVLDELEMVKFDF